jgi:hypothetical protein|tara:strand:+ start:1760 stop:3301 length:1542 start_codon:yes stop_codon:yes gene_type:complete
MDEILNQFSSHAPREKRIALQVVDYELPEHGSETPENARVIGIDTKTGQMIEVALRPYEGDRPSLGQFYDDSASSTPVTTRPGGFLIVEGAVPTQELKPLSGQNHAVYSARWLMRAGMNEDHGRAMIATARVNNRRLNATNPTKGAFQTVTVLRDDKPFYAESLQQADTAVLNALDPELHPVGRHDTFPGALGAVVRVESPDGRASEIQELFGGYYLPSGAPHKVPKTREMVAEDLAKSATWQKQRALIDKATKAGYKIGVMDARTLMVGPKAMKGKGIKPLTNEQGINLFTNYVLALRYRQDGSAFITVAKPEGFERAPSRTGLPNPEERSQSQIQESRQMREEQAAAAKPAPSAPSSANAPAQPRTQRSSDAPAMVRRAGPGALTVQASTAEQAQSLQQIAASVKGQFDQTNNVLSFGEDQLPALFQRMKNAQLPYKVDLSTANQTNAPSTAVPSNAQRNNSAPAQPSKPPSQPIEEQAPSVDLSDLDLSSIDIDGALAQAYGDAAKGPQR